MLKQTLAQPGVRVTALCDIAPDKLDAAASLARRDNPRTFTDYRKVIDLGDVDAVYIATPCDLHAEMAVAALDAGKYVYLEKPMAITPEGVDAVVKAARKAKRFLQIGQQMRYYSSFQGAISKIVQDNVIGKVLLIKAQRHSTPSRTDQDTLGGRQWYYDVKRSGDRIVENGVHNIDVCNWIANSRPVAAFGFGKVYHPKPMAAGTRYMNGYSVMYQYENEVNLTFSEGSLHPAGLKELAGGQWWIVFGEKGAVSVKRGSGLLYDMWAAGEPKQMLTPAQQENKENAVEDFFACIREQRQPFADYRVGGCAALTAIMGREAIYRKRMVTWKELGVSV
ncbi:MAG: Gfo/Idh/MocA family oxidoreductase [Acidobacteria bacterium]|nr:Gfo/Idh/MocA family oxidoreductase [Acidobacteriota bacterium]